MSTALLQMDEDERDGLFPYIWAVDRKQRLNRVLAQQRILRQLAEQREDGNQSLFLQPKGDGSAKLDL